MKRSLILGGSKGLGLALADELAVYGFPPLIIARTDPHTDHTWLYGDLTIPILWEGIAPVLSEVQYVFWVAGAFLRKPLTDCTQDELRNMTSVHLSGAIDAITGIHRLMKLARPLGAEPGRPYHLVTICSTSSWRIRDNETIYCALKAAKAHFTRNFARELVRDLPGSKVTLVHPGGMKTENFWRDTAQDITGFMDPRIVALEIMERAYSQKKVYDEYSIMRNDDGTPNVKEGIPTPESPF